MLRNKSILLGSTLVVLALFSFNSLAVQTACSKITKKQAKSAIKDDFMKNRVPFWSDKLMGNIGTKNPELTFNQKIIINNETYGIPFQATGPNNKTTFIGLYNCKTGDIEYSKE